MVEHVIEILKREKRDWSRKNIWVNDGQELSKIKADTKLQF